MILVVIELILYIYLITVSYYFVIFTQTSLLTMYNTEKNYGAVCPRAKIKNNLEENNKDNMWHTESK